jgi:hypothetical protein
MTRLPLAAALCMALAGCATTSTSSALTPATVVQTGQSVASALATALPQIALLPAVAKDQKAAAAIQKAEVTVATAQTTLAALAANLPPAQSGAATLSTVFSYLNAAVATAEAVPGLSDSVQTYLVSAGLGLIIVQNFVNTTMGTQLKATVPAK